MLYSGNNFFYNNFRELRPSQVKPDMAPEDLYQRERPRPPKFKTQIKSQMELLENQPAHFECRLIPVGDPDMKVEWYKDGVLLRHGTWVSFNPALCVYLFLFSLLSKYSRADQILFVHCWEASNEQVDSKDIQDDLSQTLHVIIFRNSTVLTENEPKIVVGSWVNHTSLLSILVDNWMDLLFCRYLFQGISSDRFMTLDMWHWISCIHIRRTAVFICVVRSTDMDRIQHKHRSNAMVSWISF